MGDTTKKDAPGAAKPTDAGNADAAKPSDASAAKTEKSESGSSGKTFTEADIKTAVETALAEQLTRQKTEAEEAARQAKLTEAQKAQERIDALEAQVRESNAEKAFRAAVAQAKLKVENADAIYEKLVKPALKYDSAGKPSNLAQILKDAERDFPQLFQPARGTADGGAGIGHAPNDMNALLRGYARRR
jgi:hypothetical protein